MPEKNDAPVLSANYRLDGFFDEMFISSEQPRPHYRILHDRLSTLNVADLNERARAADISFLYQGITLPFITNPKASSGSFRSI